MESGGKSSESIAATWSRWSEEIMYVLAMVLTSPTLGIASITVPPPSFTSRNCRTRISAKGAPREEPVEARGDHARGALRAQLLHRRGDRPPRGDYLVHEADALPRDGEGL